MGDNSSDNSKICSRIIHVQRQHTGTSNAEGTSTAAAGRAALLRGLSVDASVRAASVIVKSPRLLQVKTFKFIRIL